MPRLSQGYPMSRCTIVVLAPTAILLTGIVSIVAALDGIGLAVPGLSQLIRHLPFYADQLGWLLPAVLGITIGIVLSAMRLQSGWKKDVS